MENDFQSSCTKTNNSISEHYQNLQSQRLLLENQMLNNEIKFNDYLNNEIAINETKTVNKVLKARKAPGPYSIQSELLYCDKCLPILKSLFNKCVTHGKIPSLWLKAVIVPIPKNTSKDPYIPLNYRGISLISGVSKIYLITESIHTLIGIMAEEQNGFCKSRSCEDHIVHLLALLICKLRPLIGLTEIFYSISVLATTLLLKYIGLLSLCMPICSLACN